jgi:hypothetical protein
VQAVREGRVLVVDEADKVLFLFLPEPRDTRFTAPKKNNLILGPSRSDGGIERSGGRWRDVAQRWKEDSMWTKFASLMFSEFFCITFSAIPFSRQSSVPA